MGIVFVDTNKKLVSLMLEAVYTNDIRNVGVILGQVAKPVGVVVTASNLNFTMGGGWDAQIKKWYPNECSQVRRGTNQRIGNIIFTITVDKQLNATKKLVTEALQFALSNIQTTETLILTGLGTGIGGLSEENFIEAFVEVLNEVQKNL